jgi:hypothetical protein
MIRLTKEVKDYALNEFRNRASALRMAAADALKPRQDQLQAEADAIVSKFNADVQALRDKYAQEARTYLSTPAKYGYGNNDQEIALRVCCIMPDIPVPNESKFMAELSQGQSLDEISSMLDKYFSTAGDKPTP